MRTVSVAIFAFCLAFALQPASAAEHEFRYKAPEAQSVSLKGEFNGWKGVAMTKESERRVPEKNGVASKHLTFIVAMCATSF